MSILYDEQSPYTYTAVISVCDDIKAFVERELLQETNKDVIEAYKKVLRYIKGVRKEADEGMY